MPEADAVPALRRKLQIRTPTTLLLVSPLASRELTGAVSMGDRPHATDNALDQTDQELLIFTVSDEPLEKAAGRHKLGSNLSPDVRSDDLRQRNCGWSRLKNFIFTKRNHA
jgi:hypothetical protein